MSKRIADIIFPNLNEDIEEIEKRYKERNLDNQQMVTRFAPSPTGEIHMGSLYAAFIGEVFAKQSNGIFYLRIEDTDQKREIENGIEKIIRDLTNLKIKIDEGPTLGGEYGPYIQSERKDIYQAYVKYLITHDLAYPCFLTKEDLENIRKEQSLLKERLGIYKKYAKYRELSTEDTIKKLNDNTPFVIRLKSNGDFNKVLDFKDSIKGKVDLRENDMDIVLLKEDGLPTYHFAHVIDDHLMRTTHVIRGDEWLSSVPIHLELFKIFHFKVPKYAHISPLTKKDGDSIRKLSKRKDKEGTFHFYHEEGIPVEAIKLYLSTIMSANFEPFYLQDKKHGIDDFNFEFSKMSVSGALFDLEKLTNISKIYFSRKTGAEILEELLEHTREYDDDFYQVLNNNKDYTKLILEIERYKKSPRKDISCYKDIKSLTWYMYDEYFYKNENPYQEIDTTNYNANILEDYFNNVYCKTDSEEIWYQKLKDFGLKNKFASSTKEYNLNEELYIGHIGTLCELLRVALTTSKESPNLYEILQVLGEERIKKRVFLFKTHCN